MFGSLHRLKLKAGSMANLVRLDSRSSGSAQAQKIVLVPPLEWIKVITVQHFVLLLLSQLRLLLELVKMSQPEL